MTDQSVKTRRSSRRPSDILSAALDLFTERGFNGTRMEDVAARAGLSKAAIYLYFKDKNALLEALVRDMVLTRLSAARDLAEGHQGPASELLKSVMGFMAGQMTGSRLPDMIKLVISESRAHPEIGRFYLDNVINQGLPFFEAIIRRGVERGEFRAVDPHLAVRGMVASILFTAIWRSVFEPLGAETLDVEAFIEHQQDMLLRGLKP